MEIDWKSIQYHHRMNGTAQLVQTTSSFRLFILPSLSNLFYDVQIEISFNIPINTLSTILKVRKKNGAVNLLSGSKVQLGICHGNFNSETNIRGFFSLTFT